MSRRLIMQGLVFPRDPDGTIRSDKKTIFAGRWMDGTHAPPRRILRRALQRGHIGAWSPVCPCAKHPYPGWRMTKIVRRDS